MMSSPKRGIMGLYKNIPSAQSTVIEDFTMEERAFSVAFLFGVFWIVLAYLVEFLVLPLWNNLNVGLCFLAAFVGVSVYFTEYLAVFPISYR